MTECKRCLLTDDIPGVHLHPDGECSMCKLHDRLDKRYPISIDKQYEMIDRIRHRGRRRRYDCMIGISGGVDSSWLLQWAYHAGLRALAFHFDNGFNSTFAERNMKRMLEVTGYPCVRIGTDNHELRRLNKAFLFAGVSDVDIPNDIAMAKLMLQVARQYRIPTILNGHSFRQEGIVPLGWTYMDGRYIRDVYRKFTGTQLRAFPVLTIWDQIKASLFRIRTENPYYHMNHSKELCKVDLVTRYGWETYHGRHTENEYTAFAGWFIWERFGIDKRRLEVSAQIRSGRAVSAHILENPPEPVGFNQTEILSALQLKEKDYLKLFNIPRNMFWDFQTYHPIFRRYRLAFWLLTRMGILRRTFYEKYTRKVQR